MPRITLPSVIRLLPMLAVAAITLTAGTRPMAQELATAFPSKPVRFVVPFPPGGAADTFARMVGDKVAQAWGQPVVIDNKPGGGGIIATQAVARAPADGYTLLVVTVGHAVNPHIQSKLPYDTLNDLKPVAQLATLPSVLVVNPNVPARSVAELVTLAKSQPGKLTYASSGNATTSHVAGAMFASLSKSEWTHVPYKGSAPAISDLLGGQVSMIIDPLSSSAQHIKSGKLRALAVTTTKRSNLVPDLPTMAEAGLTGYDFSAWFMLIAPKGVAPELMKKLNEDVSRAVSSTDLKDRYVTLGAEPGRGSLAELDAFVAAEVRRFGEVAKAANMHVE